MLRASILFASKAGANPSSVADGSCRNQYIKHKENCYAPILSLFCTSQWNEKKVYDANTRTFPLSKIDGGASSGSADLVKRPEKITFKLAKDGEDWSRIAHSPPAKKPIRPGLIEGFTLLVLQSYIWPRLSWLIVTNTATVSNSLRWLKIYDTRCMVLGKSGKSWYA